jgi:F-type H+-transporting ATPase subunit epsilon
MTTPSQLTFELVTPDHGVASELVDEVQLPGTEGYLGILPGHTPLLTSLTVGELWFRKGPQKTYLSVAFGFAEVLPDRVTVLAQSAETADEIDEVRAEAQRQRATGDMQKPNLSEADFEKARASLMKALIRLQVATRRRAPRM